MKITVEFYVISDPPMTPEDMRREFVYDLRHFIGLIPNDKGEPVVEITGFNVLRAEGE